MATKHYLVKFTRRGMEPPRPFGRTSMVVCAENRNEAKAAVPASPGYPCTATVTDKPVSWTNRCHCATKTDAQLDRDIAQSLEGS